MTSHEGRRAALRCAVAAMFVLLAGCKTAPPLASTEAVSFDDAIQAATDSLVAQTRKMPAFMAKLDKRAFVIDPMLEGGSGQQTVATRQLEEKVVARLRGNFPEVEVLPFQTTNLGKAQYVLTGTMTRIVDAAPAGGRPPFELRLALTELKSGLVVAQASSRARDDGIDTTPSPYYRDSPVIVKDEIVDGYLRTTATPTGQRADPAYFERLSTAALINNATVAYNDGKYEEALGLYKTALAAPSGEQLRTQNGIYLASWKLGRTAEAEQAFGRVVALGIASQNLGVKFLFNPNSTDFWSDAKVSGPYQLWLRQIAKQAGSAKVCMHIVGHTSRTGSEAYNDRLSAQRALAIGKKLGVEAPELNARMRTSGVGFRENIIGTGSDDATDALDRRVEFKIVGC